MDPFLTRFDALLEKKQQQARDILQTKQNETTDETDVVISPSIPFEVNKVLHQIKAENVRRAKVLKRKPTIDIESTPQYKSSEKIYDD